MAGPASGSLERPQRNVLASELRGKPGFERLGTEEDRIVDEIVEAIREEVPYYANFPATVLRPVVLGEFRRGLAAVCERRAPTPEELNEFAALAEVQARHGVPVEVMLQGCRVAVRRVWELCRDYGRRVQIDADTQLDYMHALWTWADLVMVRSAAAHRSVEVDLARQDQEQRTAFVRALLLGSLPSTELRAKAATYGLGMSIRYTPFRARPEPGVELLRLARAIEGSRKGERNSSLIATLDGDLVGVATWRPRIRGGATVGLGGPVLLSEIPHSFRLASRALETGTAFGMQGVIAIDELSVLPAVVSESELGEALAHRYLAPLDEQGEFGSILEETVRAFLRFGRRVEDASKDLYVHPNTLRHRLQRFEELTGADLRCTQNVVELWWALEYRELLRFRARGSARQSNPKRRG